MAITTQLSKQDTILEYLYKSIYNKLSTYTNLPITDITLRRIKYELNNYLYDITDTKEITVALDYTVDGVLNVSLERNKNNLSGSLHGILERPLILICNTCDHVIDTLMDVTLDQCVFCGSSDVNTCYINMDVLVYLKNNNKMDKTSLFEVLL